MHKQYYVYTMMNKSNEVLYTGVSNDLRKRIFEHKEKLVEGFTKRYNIIKLVYYQACDNIQSAIAREKQIKDASRQKKVDLINGINDEWRDLYDEL